MDACRHRAMVQTRDQALHVRFGFDFTDRAFEDAKSQRGPADYQVCLWTGLHHHMTLVMITLLFLAEERLANRKTAQLLSCRDLVEMLRHLVPRKFGCD